jgi:hypothetical protein
VATRRWRRRLSSENAVSFDGTGWRNMLLLMSRAEGDVLYPGATNRCVTPARAQRTRGGKGGERIRFKTFQTFGPFSLRVAPDYDTRRGVRKGADRRNREGYELTRTERMHTRQRRRSV